MTLLCWQSLAATGLLLASRVSLAQAAPDSNVPPVAAVPIQAPPPTYSVWVLLLAGIALLLLVVAGVRLVMNGLRSGRHRRHRGNHSPGQH